MEKDPMVGRRVELIATTDPHTKLEPGDRGTVRRVGPFGTVRVEWDSGSRLGLIPEEGDRFKLLPEDEPAD